jgi:YD repeat-containing protein
MPIDYLLRHSAPGAIAASTAADGETVDGAAYEYTYDSYGRLVRTTSSGGTVGVRDWQFCFQDAAGTGGAAPACTAGDVGVTGRNSNGTAAYDGGVKIARYPYDLADRLTSLSIQAPYTGCTPINKIQSFYVNKTSSQCRGHFW